MVLFGVKALNSWEYDIINYGSGRSISFWRSEFIFPLILFAVVFGMRYDVGTDHFAYLFGYLSKVYISKNEPLFDLLSEIGWALNLHYTVYFGVIAFIQICFFFYAFKEERYLFPFLAFFLFTNGLLGFWMNGLRQALAMCIWIFSIQYIEKNKPLRYIFWGIVAILFHKSAIILLVFYPILKNGKDYFKNILIQIALLFCAFIIKFLFFDFFMYLDPLIDFYTTLLGSEMYESYSMENLLVRFSENQGTGLAYLFKIALNIFIVINSKKIKKFYDSKWFLIVYFFFFIGLLTIYMFPIGAIALTRPFRYFYAFETIMYAYFAYYLYKSKSNRHNKMLFCGFVIVFLGIFYLSHITSNENSHLWYQFYFQQNFLGYPN